MDKITKCPKCRGTDFTVEEVYGHKAFFEDGVLFARQKTNHIISVVCDNPKCLYQLTDEQIEAVNIEFC